VSNSNFTKLLELFETSRYRKLILGLQVNIDKATVADMTSPSICYIWGPAKIRNPHIIVLYILREVKFKFKYLPLN